MAWESVSVQVQSEDSVILLFAFAVAIVLKKLKHKIKKKSKTAIIHEWTQEAYLIREGVEEKEGSVILFKRVSSDYKTQENTSNETLWTSGSTVTHPAWNPGKNECGAGKFHACSRPYFCDQFRDTQGDRYVAIKIKNKDLYEWKKNPDYPHKIGFREGKVLYECDKYGKRVEG